MMADVVRITAQDDVDRIVAQWAIERPDLQTEAMAVFGRIYRIARNVGDRQESVYAEYGINRGEFDLLATLRRAGEPYQLTPTALLRHDDAYVRRDDWPDRPVGAARSGTAVTASVRSARPCHHVDRTG